MFADSVPTQNSTQISHCGWQEPQDLSCCLLAPDAIAGSYWDSAAQVLQQDAGLLGCGAAAAPARALCVVVCLCLLVSWCLLVWHAWVSSFPGSGACWGCGVSMEPRFTADHWSKKKKGSIYLFTALKERGRARACRFTSSRCRWPQGQEQKLLSGLPCGWQAIKHLSHLPLLSQAFIGQLDSKWSRPRQGPVTVWDTASLGCLTCYATMPIPGNWTLGIP